MGHIRNTPMERADNLLQSYNRKDKLYNRGKGDLTAKWIVEHIFSQPCAHCGKTGWDIIGCNRLDNSKPHTMDNVEPCCKECNDKLGAKQKTELFSKAIYQYDLDGNLVKTWTNVNVCNRNGYNKGNIYMCCIGKKKQYKGYIWSNKPL